MGIVTLSLEWSFMVFSSKTIPLFLDLLPILPRWTLPGLSSNLILPDLVILDLAAILSLVTLSLAPGHSLAPGGRLDGDRDKYLIMQMVKLV